MDDRGRRDHDLGGRPAGPVDRSQHDHAMWEKRVDALMMLLSDKKRDMLRVDELRRAIEQLGADAYEKLGYYERWTAAITANMIEKGPITTDELGRKMAEIEARDEVEFE